MRSGHWTVVTMSLEVHEDISTRQRRVQSSTQHQLRESVFAAELRMISACHTLEL